MSEWTAGYVADVDYTYGYYTELNPLRSKLALLNSGLRPPNIRTACELGFGQGLSTNLHASSSNIDWWATDFNPAQASFAQELADASGNGAKIFDQAFSEFCSRPDLPDFDFIGLHGIWSWISDDNRKIVVDFVRRKLKVGGVLYLSYNTLPGWASFAPLRHLLTQHAGVMGSEGSGILKRIDNSLDFTQKFLDCDPSFKKANQQIEERLKKMTTQNRHYLAHEYFNKDWHPMYFATAADWLSSSKVDYACSAHFLDHYDNVNLSSEQQKFMNEIPDLLFKQSVRDYMVNQQFRRDYWVKGLRRLTPLEQHEHIAGQRIILCKPKSDIELKTSGPMGDVNMNAEFYNPILDILSDHKVMTIRDLHSSMESVDPKVRLKNVVEAVMILGSSASVMPVADNQSIDRSTKWSQSINKHLIRKARSEAEVAFLASPVTGGGVPATRFQQLFIGAIHNGYKQQEQMVQETWNTLKIQQQRIVKDGKPLDSEEENLKELNNLANEFVSKYLPVFKSLKII